MYNVSFPLTTMGVKKKKLTPELLEIDGTE